MPRKAQGANAATPAAKAKRTPARKPKVAPKPAKKPAVAKKPKGRTMATAEGIQTPEVCEELESVIKRYRGRPTKYDPSFCEAVIAWGRMGKSRTWMAAEMMVARNTIDNWANDNPDFLSALDTAKQLEQQHWEDLGQDNIRAIGFQQSVWRRSMAARFPKEWRESSEVKHGLSDGLSALLGDLDGSSASIL